jgi:DNA replication and repair protein RecF
MAVRLDYRGRAELADPAAWPAMLAAALDRDLATGASSVGPHRDDLGLRLDRVPLRDAGSTGQHRTAAIALKLCERETLAGRTEPALLLDDVFSELDRDRQRRLARLLEAGATRQVFVTSPRRDELPPELDLPIFAVMEGRVALEAGPVVT